MGCSNQKQRSQSAKQLKKLCFNINKEIIQLQRKILFTNVEYQFKYTRLIEKKAHTQEKKLNMCESSNISQDEHAKEDLICQFYDKMKEFQKLAQKIFLKCENHISKYNIKIQSVQNEQIYENVKYKLKLLHDFAFVLVINSETKNSQDHFKQVGSFCQSLIIA